MANTRAKRNSKPKGGVNAEARTPSPATVSAVLHGILKFYGILPSYNEAAEGFVEAMVEGRHGDNRATQAAGRYEYSEALGMHVAARLSELCEEEAEYEGRLLIDPDTFGDIVHAGENGALKFGSSMAGMYEHIDSNYFGGLAPGGDSFGLDDAGDILGGLGGYLGLTE